VNNRPKVARVTPHGGRGLTVIASRSAEIATVLRPQGPESIISIVAPAPERLNKISPSALLSPAAAGPAAGAGGTSAFGLLTDGGAAAAATTRQRVACGVAPLGHGPAPSASTTGAAQRRKATAPTVLDPIERCLL
jgi:hypothetical protein